MTSTFRIAEGGRIDRATTVEFTFDGQAYTGHPGDTLASALLASGRPQIATSITLGRPRGIAAAWAEDPGGLVQIEEPFPEPMLLATTVELHDGVVAHGDEQCEGGGSLLSGTDRLDDASSLQWVAAAVAELAGHPEVLHLQRTT